MRLYKKELTFLCLQTVIFYLLPPLTKDAGPMGMVFILLIGSFALSLFLGAISRSGLRFFYPFAAALLFIPSVFIYYNESALIHAVWYLVISSVGILIGALIGKIFR